MASKRKPVEDRSKKAAEVKIDPAVVRSADGKALIGRPSKTIAQQRAQLNALRNKVNNKYGEESPVLVSAENLNVNSYLRRPSGIMQLDIDTGGGLPAQAMVTIGGPPNAGKSTLLYHYYAQHQRLYGESSFIAHAAPEGLDYLQARRCGWVIPVPLNVIEAEQEARKSDGRPLLTEDEVADLRTQIGQNDIIEVTTMEEYLDILEDLLSSNLYGIIGCDSYESMIPKAEAALDSLEDFAQQAARASIITRFLQHYGAIRRNPEHYTTFIMTTQVRTNRKKAELPGPMQKYVKDYSDDKSAWSLQHWRAIHIMVDSGAKINASNKDKEVVGKEYTWKIPKGKEGCHDNTHGSTPYYYDDRCFDTLSTVLAAGIKYGIIKEKDGTLSAPGVEAPSRDSFVQALLEHPEVEWGIRKAICNVAEVSSIYC